MDRQYPVKLHHFAQLSHHHHRPVLRHRHCPEDRTKVHQEHRIELGVHIEFPVFCQVEGARGLRDDGYAQLRQREQRLGGLQPDVQEVPQI